MSIAAGVEVETRGAIALSPSVCAITLERREPLRFGERRGEPCQLRLGLMFYKVA